MIYSDNSFQTCVWWKMIAAHHNKHHANSNIVSGSIMLKDTSLPQEQGDVFKIHLVNSD